MDELVAIVRELASQGELPRDLKTLSLDEDTTLGGLALDSLGKFALVSALDTGHGIYLPDDLLSDDTNLGALVAGIERAKRAKS
jgi:acyl carrier protein